MKTTKSNTIGFLVTWCGEVVCDEEETGIDVELQNIYSQPIRSKKDAKAFVQKYLSNYIDVKIVKVVSL